AHTCAFFFFFSSRRRHTRFSRDWSSDVCSSDLFSFSQIQIGSDIDGETLRDEFGYSVDLSSNGSIVAIGARYNDGNGGNAGHVRIFENQLGNWVQIGSDIDGEATGDNSGHSVSLSSDGSIVAIGATTNGGNGASSGQVRVYENQSGSWVQIG